MDVFNLAFYAIICALLSLVAPRLGRRSVRLAVGAAVGVIAASALPLIRAGIGSY